jgi:hypothetical protein
MQGFKYFIESYADFAAELGHSGPTPIEAVNDVVDYKKIIKLADFVLGTSKMILMLKPTLKSNIDVAYDLRKVMRSPKKIKYWKQLAKSVSQSSKLALANPLVLFPTISPFLAALDPTKQTIILGALKALSTTYFYLTSLANSDVENEKIKEILNRIKPFLPDIYDQKNKQS